MIKEVVKRPGKNDLEVKLSSSVECMLDTGEIDSGMLRKVISIIKTDNIDEVRVYTDRKEKAMYEAEKVYKSILIVTLIYIFIAYILGTVIIFNAIDSLTILLKNIPNVSIGNYIISIGLFVFGLFVYWSVIHHGPITILELRHCIDSINLYKKSKFKKVTRKPSRRKKVYDE